MRQKERTAESSLTTPVERTLTSFALLTEKEGTAARRGYAL